MHAYTKPVFSKEGLEEGPVPFVRGYICNALTSIWHQLATQLYDLFGGEASVCLLEVPAPNMEGDILRVRQGEPNPIKTRQRRKGETKKRQLWFSVELEPSG